MKNRFLTKGLDLLTRRQTNILSAAFVIMITVVLSQVLGLIRQRLLVSIFGASNKLGIYLYSTQLPDTVFQLTIAAALASAFIPVFSEYLARGKEKEAHKMASTLLTVGIIIFSIFSVILAIFAQQILQIFNLGSNFSPQEMILMANLMRIIIIGQLLFIIATFFTALLQSYNHFFVPGIAAALYNLGIIIGVLVFAPIVGIYSTAIGVILGGLIFIGAQIPLARKVGFHFRPDLSYIKSDGVKKIGKLMWPRTLSVIIFQLGTIAIGAFISFLNDPGRMNVIFDFAQTLAFAPVALFGQTIAQAAFPVLAREKDKLEEFKATFIQSFNQMLYLVLPVSVLFLVLRIPLVRLVFGASKFDWPATVLTGETLALFSVSIFAQALITLVLRAFYALHDTKVPLIVGGISTALLIIIAYLFIANFHMGVQSLGLAFSIASLFQLVVLFLLLEKKVGGFGKSVLFPSWAKFFISSFLTAFALYIPIKLLDQLVFDTTRTINLIILTGISSSLGLLLYLFLTWFFDVKEAQAYVLMFKKIGNWREILKKSQELLGTNRTTSQ
ncbi:MAG TPA: murein biosynthesis integral membrane protein MurJ [Candidatus Acidoferrales bacterium]|nr:murein biosynthesis integral membrane protein MurJ [Candidatus Acidoferrales bacterium]